MADRRLQVFCAVAKHLSFTRAAEALFMTQPAVTFHIRQLEEQLNSRLFERRHGNISLTSTGDLVLSYAEKILALSDEMETRLSDITGEMNGLLLIGACSSISEAILPRLLAEFNALYPLVRVRLSIANSENIEMQVAAHQLDIGLMEVAAKAVGVRSEVCSEDELVLICTPEDTLAKNSVVTPKILADYEYVSREPGSGTREIIEAYFQENKVPAAKLKIQMELGSTKALKAVVESGLGFAIVTRSSVEKEVERGSLASVALKPPLQRSLYLAYSKDRFQSKLTTTFIKFLKRKLKDLVL